MDAKVISRRRFLRLAAVGAGAGTLACCGGMGLVLSSGDHPDTAMPFGFPDLADGDTNMEKNVLIAYASAAGSTGSVAEMIGQTLAESGLTVDVCPAQSVTSLDGYDAVVLGSPVHGGKWLPEAVDFLQANQARLEQLPVAFFLTGLMVNRKDEGTRKLVGQFLAEQRALVQPLAEGHFVGAMLTKDHPGLEGFGIRFFLAYCGLGFRGGDFRDPAAIRAWAESVRPLLIA